jgi:probable F420-dependent oxidoreductase
VRFTTALSMIDPTFYAPLAQAAERAGFDAIHLADSICYPEHSESTYPYTPGGERAFLENKPFIEPLGLVAALSAVTSRIQFVVSVLKLPIRHPVILAKEVTSVAVLSGNRLQVGVGTSPWPDDYAVVGVPWAGRGRRFEEAIEIVRGLSTGRYFRYDGECYAFPAIKLNPTPSVAVPILIGGHSDANVRRAARLADGWISAGSTTEVLTTHLDRLHALRLEYERGDEAFAVHATTVDSFRPDGVRRLEDLGVTHTGGGFSAFDPYQLAPDTEPLQAKIDAINRYGDEVITKVRT